MQDCSGVRAAPHVERYHVSDVRLLALRRYSVELSMINNLCVYNIIMVLLVCREASDSNGRRYLHASRSKIFFCFVASFEASICQQEARRSLSCFKLTCKISICLENPLQKGQCSLDTPRIQSIKALLHVHAFIGS